MTPARLSVPVLVLPLLLAHAHPRVQQGPTASMRVAPASGAQASATATPSHVAALLDRFAGRWRGQGTVTGRSSDVEMTWEPALQRAFVHLMFRNAMTAADGSRTIFEARGYYRREAAGASTGVWVDSRGLVLPLQTSASPDTLTSDWGGADTERGRTTYRLVDAATLEVVDAVYGGDGQLREFGRTVLKRIP